MSVSITAIEEHKAMKSTQAVPEKWDVVAVHTDFHLQ